MKANKQKLKAENTIDQLSAQMIDGPFVWWNDFLTVIEDTAAEQQIVAQINILLHDQYSDKALSRWLFESFESFQVSAHLFISFVFVAA